MIRVFFISIFVALFAISACQQSKEEVVTVTVAEEELAGLKIGSFFPTDGLTRTYVNYGMEDDSEWYTRDLVKRSEEDKTRYTITAEDDLTGKSKKEFIVDEETIKITYMDTAVVNKETDELMMAKKQQWDVGASDSDDSISYLTAIHKNVQVKAGVFPDCIEVTNVSDTTGQVLVSKNYYAPKVGLIKTIFVLVGEEFVFTELHSFKTDRTDGTDEAEEAEEVEEAEENEEAAVQEEVLEEESAYTTPNGKLSTTTYMNEDLNFSIKVPSSWLHIVEADDSYGDQVHFYYVPNGEIRQYIFSINVYSGVVEPAYFEGGFEFYIDTDGKNTYVYQEPSEPVEALMDPKYQAELEHSQHMVYEELPAVIQTFEFIR